MIVADGTQNQNHPTTTKELKQTMLRWLAPWSLGDGPPPHIKAFVGPIHQWNNPETVQTLVRLGLREEDHVLDFGCGAGRLADALHKLGVRRYTGMDVNLDVIEYARNRFGYPGFTYLSYDAYNSTYNPRGQMRLRPQIPGGPTIAISVSVVTHLLPAEVAELLQVFSGTASIRRCLISCFCTQDPRLARRVGARVEIDGGAWIKRQGDPHAVVVYRPDILTGLAARNNWTSRLEQGCWREKSGRQALAEGIPYQDYLVLTR